MDTNPADIAATIAHNSHNGQTGRDGQPYINHPQRVAERLQQAGLDSRIVAAGWLHDLLEDTDYPHDALAANFDEPTIAAIEAVTRQPDETYQNLIGRAAHNPWAAVVKTADLLDHLEPQRRHSLPPGNLTRYRSALAVLAERLEAHVESRQIGEDAMNLWVDAQIRLDELDGFPSA